MVNYKNIKKMVVGQDKLITDLLQIFEIFEASNGVIRPHFILTGGSGTGKSLTIAYLANLKKLGYLEINAAQLTKEGTSGNSLSKALSPLMNMGDKKVICFVDEFDKLFISGNSNDSCAHETTTGVQNEFLRVLESNIATVFGDYGKYVNVKASNVLFIFAGAFNNEEHISLDRLRDLGLKTEFLGRVGLVYSTRKLTLENLFEVLETSVLLETYLRLYQADRERVVLFLKGIIQRQFEKNTIGARLVNTLIHQYFIKKGNITENDEKDMSFQRTLSLDQ